MTQNESLEKISKSLMLSEPFYGLFLITLNKVWKKNLPTAGVSKNNIGFQLAINPEFWESLSDLHKQGLLKHELLHIAFFHLLLRERYSDKKIFNYAADIEINQYIDKDKLPEGALLPSSFPELSLDNYAGTQYYYEKLIQDKQDGKSPMLQSLLTWDDENDIYDHPTWDEFEELDEATKKLIQKQTEHILKDVAESIKKSRGHVPGEMVSILDAIENIEPPKFDWRGYLRRFAGGSVKVYTKKLRRKFNKRYEDNPGLKIKPKKHILVAIDTSGSVSNEELVEFFKEIHHIHKTGTEVTVVLCDAAIQKIYEYNPKHKIELSGRGGKLCFHM